VDFNNKKFNKVVGRVDMGTLTYTYNSDTKRFETVSLNTVLKPITSSSTVANLLCDIYSTTSGQTQYDDLTLDMTISQGTTDYPTVRIRNLAYTDATQFKNSLSGIYLYFELRTPVQTDISAYLTNDNFIEVEAGGSITANNTYNQAVPSEITYLVEV
jgi:hypothetical protein